MDSSRRAMMSRSHIASKWRGLGDLRRRQTVPRRTAAQALLPFIGILFSGCAIHPPIHSELHSRLTKSTTVAISPPYVMGYIQPYHLSETRRVILPDIAASNLAAAVSEQFGRSEYFL